MYKVRCGIKLEDWENGQVFGAKELFKSINEAKIEVNRILNTCIKEMFPEETHDEIFMVSKVALSANYLDGTELIGRMDGKVEDGEFYIEIVK